MSTWDENIFSTDLNVDFLDEMANLDEEGVIRAVEDACEVAHSKPKLSEEKSRMLKRRPPLLPFGLVRRLARAKLSKTTPILGNWWALAARP